MRTILISAVAAVVLAAGACGDEGGGQGDRLEVVTALYPLAWVAAEVGGPDVEVRDLTSGGAEAHDLELGPDEVERIEDADLVVLLGGGFQPAVEEASDRRDGDTLVLRDELDVRGDDPHVWLDPQLMDAVVVAVTEALVAAAPEELAEGLRARGAELEEQLGLLDADTAEGLEGCARSTIVTAHDSFGRFAERYGLRQEALAQTPEEEPDPARLDGLVDLVREERLTVVFTEVGRPSDAARTLAREAGVDTAELDTLEHRPAAGGYLEAMRRNLEAVRSALGCP